MGEDEKKDYRLHLINTIDNAIDNGISVYDLDVVNKKAIRHNYIKTQTIIDKIEEIKGYLEYADTMCEYTQKDVIEECIKTLQKLLGGEK